MSQIAKTVGVARQTLSNQFGPDPEFLDTLKEARDMADQLVEATLFRRAVGYTYDRAHLMRQGYSIVTKKVEKHVPPDITARIFWLKNRKPSEWRDRVALADEGRSEEVYVCPSSHQLLRSNCVQLIYRFFQIPCTSDHSSNLLMEHQPLTSCLPS